MSPALLRVFIPLATLFCLSACSDKDAADDDDDDGAAASDSGSTADGGMWGDGGGDGGGDDGGSEDGWVTVVEGLQVRDTVEGEGDEVASGDTITAHYTLWLYEDDAKGEELQTSTEGSPFSVQLGAGRLIEGWELGIPGMKVGGTRELILAPELAYGSTGSSSGGVPGDATLFFEVQLLSFE